MSTRKQNQVIFYYPQHFNRGVLGENLLFKPFVEYCENNDVVFKLIEEPDKNSIYPSNSKAEKFNLFFILVLRKLLPLNLFNNFETREQFIGKVFRFLTANRYKSNIVFTLSNSLGGFWRGYNPKARIIDYQHGIINKNQTGFFNNAKAPLHIKQNNKEVAVWGKGFKIVFEQEQEYYANKVHVFGYFSEKKLINYEIDGRDKIVFMLQFMPDIGDEMNAAMLDLLKDTINQFETLSIEKRPNIILKSHPRHNHILDLKAVFNDFDFVQVWSNDDVIDSKEALINVTYFSTSAFEMAENGVPSFFLFNEKLQHGKEIFLTDYNYPLQKNETLLDFWSTYQNNPNLWIEHSKIVKEWVNDFFEPFDTKKLEQLITASNHEQ